MSKDQLEEIKRINSEHMKQHYGTSAVPTEHFKWLIEQAERAQELEKENHLYKLRKENAKELNNVVIKPLKEQNKRYREALENIVNAPQSMSRGQHSSYSDMIASSALEGDPHESS